MKIYLASRYGRRKELLGYAGELKKLGHVVTSRWLSGEHNSVDRKFKGHFDDDIGFLRLIQKFARADLEDLFKADCLIVFIENKFGRGGHHVEFGAVLGWNRGMKTTKWCREHEPEPKRVIAVGHCKNIFYNLPSVIAVKDWDQALKMLKKLKLRERKKLN